MNPHDVFCPNPDCPARGRCGEGNIWVHARTPPRYRCTVCNTTFSPRAGTLFHRRQTDEAIIAQVVTLVAHGCPIAAIVVAYGVQRQTVCAWLDAAGRQCEAVHRHLNLPTARFGCGAGGRNPGAPARGDRLAGAGDGGRDSALARRSGQPATRWGAARPVVRAGAGMRPARTAAGLGGRLRRLCPAGVPDGPLPAATRRQTRALSARGVAGIGDRPSGQAARRWSCRRGDAAAGTRYRTVGGTLARWRHDPDGVHRAAEWDVPRPVGGIGASDTGRRADGGATGSGDVAGGYRLQRLHPAWQPGTQADPGDGEWDHRSPLARGRTAALPGASCCVATAEKVGKTHESGGGAH